MGSAQDHPFVACPVCGNQLDLQKEADTLTDSPPDAVFEMDRIADAAQDRSTGLIVLEGKKATADFDVFLCCDATDRGQCARSPHN